MDSQIVVAVIGLLGLVGGWVASRIGQRAELRQKALTEQAAQEHAQFAELKSMLPELREEAERAYQARDAARAEAEVERTRRVDAMTAADLAVDQYRRTARKALEDLEVLRGLVVTQITQEAERVAAEAERREQPSPAPDVPLPVDPPAP